MENSAANTDLIRGHVITIILRSLEGSDKYGYEICREIEVKSEGSYVLKQPTLYSCLKRLESQEYITSYNGEISNGGKRRYYSLTEKGREYLERDKQEWEFSRTLINRLLSDKDYDLTAPPPFDASELRPYTRKMTEFSQSYETQAEDVEQKQPITQQPTQDDIKNESAVQPEFTTDNVDVINSEELEKNEIKTEEQLQTAPPRQLNIFDALQTAEEEKEENNVNYKNAFSKLFDSQQEKQAPQIEQEEKTEKIEEKTESESKLPSTLSELKKKYYSEGFTLKPYSFSNVVIYYNMNYVYANKLNLFTYWLTYAFILLEIGLIRLFFGVNYGLTDGLYIASILGGLIIPGIPTVSYFMNPLKRIKADFDFKTSIINRSLLCLNLSFVFACLGVFVWQVNLQELSTMVLPIFIPIILLLNFPLSSIIYYQIYKTKKFHLT